MTNEFPGPIITLLMAGELHGDLLRTSARPAQPEEQEQPASPRAPAARAVRRGPIETGSDQLRRHQRAHRRGQQGEVLDAI